MLMHESHHRQLSVEPIRSEGELRTRLPETMPFAGNEMRSSDSGRSETQLPQLALDGPPRPPEIGTFWNTQGAQTLYAIGDQPPVDCLAGPLTWRKGIRTGRTASPNPGVPMEVDHRRSDIGLHVAGQAGTGRG
jgi:hypothetical protein